MVIEAKHEACGSGPVIVEDWAMGFRAICCACWTHSPVKLDQAAAAAAWADKAAHIKWRDGSMPKQASK